MDIAVKRKTNPVLRDIITQCEETARKHEAPVWSDVAEALKKSNRKQAEVNVSDINRTVEDGETVVVPGKVMGSGRLEKDVTVAALNFTLGAREAVNTTGNAVYIEDLVSDNPDGSNVRMMR